MIENGIFETVKEYTLWKSGFDFTVRARISKQVVEIGEPHFEWSISHNYPGTNGGSAHFPSEMSGNSFDKVKKSLFLYLGSFPSSTNGFIPNKDY